MENIVESPKDEMRYGERIVKEFNVDTDLEVWENKHNRDYTIKITLPEFCCLCPRSGYPDFATIYIEYIPAKLVVELKAIKLYINSFMNRNISHEDSINEIYSVLESKIAPKYMKITGDFNPRGNVHTVIEISSDIVAKKSENVQEFKGEDNYRAGARRISERENDKKRDSRGGLSDKSRGIRNSGGRDGGFKRDSANRDSGSRGSKDRGGRDDKPKRSGGMKDGFRKIAFEGDKKASVRKKDS